MITMAPPRKAKRRCPGEGGVYPYKSTRYFWKAPIRQPDGTTKTDIKGGFLTTEAALADMQEALVAGRKGEYVEPSKQPLRLRPRGHRGHADRPADPRELPASC
jgi:hypothetical protein